MRFRIQLYQGRFLVTSWRRYSDFVTIQTAKEDGTQGESAMLSVEEFDALPWVSLAVVPDAIESVKVV